MVNREWILRNVIIWHKPNCVPESVKDRFTTNFEYLFFFTKQKKYYFQQQFEPMKETSIQRLNRGFNDVAKDSPKMSRKSKQLWANKYKSNTPRHRHGGDTDIDRYYPQVNKRSVWTISLKPFHEAHFAVFPPDLIEIPIKAGCPIDGIVLDPFMGSGTTAIVAKKQGKNYIGIELNPEYIDISQKRILNEFPNKAFSNFV
jgi:site-specific DNA-methyltransferase (adenine-specific)